jgi:hypothetical protein
VRYTKLFPHLGNFPSTYGEEWTSPSFWTTGFNSYSGASFISSRLILSMLGDERNLEILEIDFYVKWKTRAGSTFELAHLTRCLVMLKTIIMGERQESVVGIRNGTFIVQC